jgi:hypothetical protein
MWVGIWSMAWGPFLWNLEEGIVAAAAAATMPTMTTCWDAFGREKVCTSYHALFQDLGRCRSYVRDVGYRTPGGGWLIESVLNSLPRGISDLAAMTMTTGGRRGEGGGMTSAPNGN